MDRAIETQKDTKKYQKEVETNRKREKRRKHGPNKQTKSEEKTKMSILFFMYFSIESNEPKFLSMDTDESEFSAFPQDPAGVAKKLIIKKNHVITSIFVTNASNWFVLTSELVFSQTLKLSYPLQKSSRSVSYAW